MTKSVKQSAVGLIACGVLLLVGCRTTSDHTPPDLRRRIDALQGVVERLRGARFLHPVEGRYLERSRLLQVYDSTSFELGDPADSAWGPLLWAFGFIDSLDQNDNAADSVDRASIGAFYAQGVLWVVDDVRDSVSELDVTVVHELVHALQDQRYHLSELMRRSSGIDARLALQYLIEGEARFVETMYVESNRDSLLKRLPTMPLDAYRDSLRFGEGLDPEVVTIPVFHPYDQGSHVLAARWAAGGWPAIDRWWKHPPQTTQCFLEMGSYCFAPPRLELAPLVSLPAPWRRIHRGRLGAVYTNILFSLWHDSASWPPRNDLRAGSLLDHGLDLPPDRITSGMVSDSFALFEGDSGGLALTWRTSWSDQAAASRFLDAWARLLVRKERDDVLVEDVPGTVLLAHDEGAGVWDRVERFGSEVWIAEGIPGAGPLMFEGGARRTSGTGKPRP